MRKAFFLAFLMIGFLLSCNPEAQSNLQVICTSGETSEINYYSARINGSATISYAQEEIANAFFYYSSTAEDVTSLKNIVRIEAGEISAKGGIFDVVLNELDPATQYYYIASVVIDGEEFIGQVKSFSTLELPSESVTTGEIDNLTEKSVSISASFHPQYDNKNVTKGILYSENSSFGNDDCERVEASEVQDYAYSISIDGLSSNMTYYYRAYIQIDDNQCLLGGIKSFTTEAVKAKVSTIGVSDVSKHECVLLGSLDVQSIASLPMEISFYYSKTANTIEAMIDSGSNKLCFLSSDNTFQVNLSGLDDDETYYFMAAARVYDKVFYGEIFSFKTLAYPYKVSTLEADNVSVSTCTLNGMAICNIEGAQFSTFFYISSTDNTTEGLVANGKRVEVERNHDNTFSYNLTNLNPQSKYYYVAGCIVDGTEHYASVSSFNTGKLVLEAVDLGLSVKWSSCNIGASAPEEYGCYYSWGEVNTKEEYNKLTYKWFSSDGTTIIKYCWSPWSQFRDDKHELDPEDDVAQVLTGGEWRMPTKQDLRDLLNNCTWVYTTHEGVAGCLVTSKINNNSIFIPASGVYNGTTLYGGERGSIFSSYTWGDDCATCLYFYESDRLEISDSYRYLGHPVRPVRE